MAGGVIGAAAGFYDTYQQKSTATKERRMIRAMWNQQMEAYQKSQAQIWSAYNQEVQQQATARNEYLEGQRERWEPYVASQKQALTAYQKAAYEPEISDYAKLRMEESEKAINKELARRGILFSGAASELREKSRRTIVGEETEKAKTMLEKLTTGISPVEPGFIAPAQVGIPGGVGMPGIPSAGSGGVASQGASTAVNALMAGVSGYQQAAGYEQAMGIQNPWYKVGLGYGTPTSTQGLY